MLEDGQGVQLTITVLDRTETVGGVITRVVEERQLEKGQLVEVSLNYFAICAESQSVFYFGEAVDNYKRGKIVNHHGAWRHGVGGATAGLIMPALPLLGARYYQEVAPGVAMDRAEITAVNSRLRTPYAALDNVLVTRESTPLELGVFGRRSLCPWCRRSPSRVTRAIRRRVPCRVRPRCNRAHLHHQHCISPP